MRIAFVRHTSLAESAGRCYGRLDLPLAATADQEIGAVLDRLKGFVGARLWTSPADRCLRLSSAIGPLIGNTAALDDRLLELQFGDWEGRSWEDVPRSELDRWASDPIGFTVPGGESGATLIARATSFYHSLTGLPGDHVVVSHGGPLRVLLALAAGRAVDLLAPAPPLGSVAIVEC